MLSEAMKNRQAKQKEVLRKKLLLFAVNCLWMTQAEKLLISLSMESVHLKKQVQPNFVNWSLFYQVS